MKKKYIAILIVVTLVVVGAVVGLFMSGRLIWSAKGNQQLATKPVCGSAIVDSYNSDMFMVKRTGSDVPSLDTAGLKIVQKQIESKAGYKDDATCQSILFWLAINNSDYQAANTAYKEVKQLHDQGMFADNNIRGNDALLNYSSVLYSISPQNKEPKGGQ